MSCPQEDATIYLPILLWSSHFTIRSNAGVKDLVNILVLFLSALSLSPLTCLSSKLTTQGKIPFLELVMFGSHNVYFSFSINQMPLGPNTHSVS